MPFRKTRRMQRPAQLLLVLATLLAACGGNAPGQEVSLCDGPAGTWTDLTTEPQSFRDGSSPRIDWTDDAGCAVNLEFVFHRFGDDHCEWETAEFVSIGVPLGEPYTGPNATPPGQDWEPLFFHNTDGALDHMEPGRTLSELPDDAIDVGLRAIDGRELWAAPDTSELYVVQDDSVRVFVPALDEDVSCA